MPDLVDLDLGQFDMRGDLFNFWSPWEIFQLVNKNNGNIGASRLLHRLIAHHVELVLQITASAMWGIGIPISSVGGFFISVSLAIGVLRQAGIVLVDDFTIFGDAVMTDMKDLAPQSPAEREGNWGRSR